MSNKKYITSVLLLLSMAAGMNYNMVSVTLLQLKSLMKTSLIQISGVFTARSAGYLASGPIAGLTVTPYNRIKILMLHVVLMATTFTLIPLSNRLPMAHVFFYTSAAINGIASGGLESILNIWLLELWDKRSSPFMQSLHFAFSFGCAMSPIIAVSFISDPDLVFYPYIITAAIQIMALVLLVIHILLPRETRMRRQNSAEKFKLETKNSPISEDVPSDVNALDPTENQNQMTNNSSLKQRQVILLSSLFLICYSGTIIIYNQFLPTYLQTSYFMAAEKSSYIHSALNHVSMVARAASILIAVKFPPQYLLFFNLITFNTGSLFLILFSGSGEQFIWAGNMLIGSGMGGCTGPLYSFLNQHISISDLTGSLFVFCNGFTSVIVPLMMGSLMTSHPLSLMWFNVVTMTTALLIFVAIDRKCSSDEKPGQSVDPVAGEGVLVK